MLCDDSEAVPALIRWLARDGRWQENGSGRLMCQFLELLSSKDAHRMEELEDQLGSLEEQVLSGRLDRFTAPISGLRRELMHWFRYFSQMGDVADALEEDDWGLFTEEEGGGCFMLTRESTERKPHRPAQRHWDSLCGCSKAFCGDYSDQLCSSCSGWVKIRCTIPAIALARAGWLPASKCIQSAGPG